MNASSLPVVFCHGLLFLPASGLDMDSGDCVLACWCCGVFVLIYLSVVSCVFFDRLILCKPIVSLHQSRPHFTLFDI